MPVVIVGGGIVGLSIAYGLLKTDQSVVVLDGAEEDFRASHGNFGLVWVQGKGANAPAYASWTRQSAALWQDYAADLLEETGVDVSLSQTGGIEYFTDAAELEAYVARLTQLRDDLGGDYPFDVLDREAVKERVPEVGEKVIGGVFSTMDGHVNPLKLLRALTIAVRKAGGDIFTGVQVVDIEAGDDGFAAVLKDGTKVDGERLILAAGLGALQLGHNLGFSMPIRPQQGQVLITEKLPYFLKYPSGTLRQVNEGGVQIGASKAEVGMIDSIDIPTVAKLAKHATDIFPHLGKVKLVRSWAALRIMSQDGLPIYQRSTKFPRASFVTCHSGITLSAAHARLLPDWILERNTAPDLSHFSESRFHV
ncbi:glycine/D-amino acid oxidase-like deaminating enzyme [Pacificibacter maritimus]|uniref:Glycine/D-amino acid oxidase-like deaminating enzyme n=1 Tax=Pacificibacter maritimus TaxID=762213 RepID=A0A3N4UJH5_9RHOB|nr:FAD-dependent oxidoreductase [Pacificibacter maritimus]RPE67481.1 glycine/D-amino acid oxidase-like deaminating enzyme [Pacificibacter maritimus]